MVFYTELYRETQSYTEKTKSKQLFDYSH